MSDPLNRSVTRSTRWVFRNLANHYDTFEGRDRVMAMLGPVSLLTLLLSWLALVLGAYLLIYLGIATDSPVKAVELSGSSITTLGTTTTAHGAAALVTYTEAGLGLLIITLLITYLPSIYGAFSRRENGVGLLGVRAGTPPRAATMLIRFHRINEVGIRLSELWRTWEQWFIDVEETHSTFPILMFFRSPQAQQSWLTASGVVLDTAAFWVAAIEHPKDPDAQLALRAGFLTLRRLADISGLTYDPDPAPDEPISVSRAEFEEVLDEMAAAGMTIVADRDAAWKAWAGWRVNYDSVLLNLARLIEAPPTPWVSDRSPMRRPVPTSRSGRPRWPAGAKH
ncbi:hypothetical protein K6U06_13720 [Acidiferrimicrobium sp. IK]|uniref:hypothetical protein n=1 Tax=Acidiferrimicrobium sp. IK TaxID=2871700 RepID=UPI0021CB7BE4|nr:hypothetical protein [Acidiferrimicrobium sp. IK]MCU4185426.1 hypothetical protein [Acidiferrimicrobium sp. IK]